jgi:hypothetical protein
MKRPALALIKTEEVRDALQINEGHVQQSISLTNTLDV